MLLYIINYKIWGDIHICWNDDKWQTLIHYMSHTCRHTKYLHYLQNYELTVKSATPLLIYILCITSSLSPKCYFITFSPGIYLWSIYGYPLLCRLCCFGGFILCWYLDGFSSYWCLGRLISFGWLRFLNRLISFD